MGIDLGKEAAFWHHITGGAKEDALARANREAMEWRETAQEEHGRAERLEQENTRLREALEGMVRVFWRMAWRTDEREAVTAARAALEPKS